MENKNQIKVMIVDDMEAQRRKFERILNKQDDITLISKCSNGYEAVINCALYKPDIILMDIEMESEFAGIEAAKQINKNFPDIKIIILTVHEDDHIIFAAFQTGIVDYIIKTSADIEIINGIKSAYNNLSPIRPIIATKIRNEFQRVKNNEESLLTIVHIFSLLTPSELEVLQLLCNNKKRKEIAKIRCVELDTIKKQITSILKKFERKTTKELVNIINDLKIFDVINNLKK